MLRGPAPSHVEKLGAPDHPSSLASSQKAGSLKERAEKPYSFRKLIVIKATDYLMFIVYFTDSDANLQAGGSAVETALLTMKSSDKRLKSAG